MPRKVTTARRRNDLFDLFFQPEPASPAGVDTYRFEWATNFDAAPVALFTIPRWGFSDPLLTPLEHSALSVFNNPNQARVAFKGFSYSIPQTAPVWLRVVYLLNGVDTTTSGWQLLPAYDTSYRPVVVLAGVVPSAASLATSLELNLPYQLTGWTVTNLSATALKMAFAPGGPELTVPPLATQYPTQGTSGVVYVRGDGAPVTVSIQAAYPYGLLFPSL